MKKGFTLIELLAVIAILAVILLIVVPKVMSIIDDSEKTSFEYSAKSLLKAAEAYINDNYEGINKPPVGKGIIITAQQMLDSGNIAGLNDMTNSVVVLYNNQGKYEQYVFASNGKHVIEGYQTSDMIDNVVLGNKNYVSELNGITAFRTSGKQLIYDVYDIQKMMEQGDLAFGVLATVKNEDGSYIFVGRTDFCNEASLKIAKYSANFTEIWNKTYGGSGEESAEGISKTNDGGYIIVGYSSSNNGDVTGGNKGGRDIWVIKIDALGNIQWNKTYGGSGEEIGHSIIQTQDGGYILTGRTESRNGDFVIGYEAEQGIAVIKITAAGIVSWVKVYDEVSFGAGTSIIEANEGGYAIFANISDYPYYNSLMLIKITVNGSKTWSQSYLDKNLTLGLSLIQNEDNEYLLIASTRVLYSTNHRIIKTTQTGSSILDISPEANGSGLYSFKVAGFGNFYVSAIDLAC